MAPKLQIVIAWTEDGVEIVRERRTDLGERPVTRDIKVPHACMWLNAGDENDVKKAQAFAQKEGHRVFTFASSVRDPLGEAKFSGSFQRIKWEEVMSDGLHLFKKLNDLGVHAIKNPNGTYSLVGRVPTSAGYERKDGLPLTEDDIAAMVQCGPGFAKNVRARTYASEEEALKAASEAMNVVPEIAIPIVKLAKGTLYMRGEMMGNIHRIEARDIEISIKPWAQYTRAVHVTFTKKGARRVTKFVQTYKPSLVVLEGWDHVEPDSMFGQERASGEGVTVAHGRYSSCDEGWERDFAVKLAAYVEKSGAKIVADYRGHDSN